MNWLNLLIACAVIAVVVFLYCAWFVCQFDDEIDCE